MSVGTNPVTQQNVNSALSAQAAYLGDAYATIKRYLIQLQTALPNTAAMTAAGFTATADQTEITQFMTNLQTLVNCFEGTETAINTHNMIADIAALRGPNG